jgi:LuxR family transcriptional regulator, maltose regulon positive regulatory protein
MLLVAPAGYGKTTLARQWLEGKPHVWFHVAPDSTDVAALALGLASVATDVVPAAADHMRAQLKAVANLSDTATLASSLVGYLEPWPADIRLVIDDYHLLSGEPAERFIEVVVSETSVPLLITSRVRPVWVTAKKLLYGEAVELGRTTLAMTHDEAAETLARGHEDMPGLASLAQGWPAVIGLAALLPSAAPRGDEEVPETLHEYFAEELYVGLSDELKWSLAQLALAPSLDDNVSRTLLGRSMTQVLRDGSASGFLSRAPVDYEMHPLLRQFLRSKLREFPREEVIATAQSLANVYIALDRWDDAVRTSVEHGLPSVVLEVLDVGLEEMLSEGRITTVERWLAHARTIAPTAPIVRLAEIEIAFRARDSSSARESAPELARSVPPDHKLASRIYFCAGQIAHLDDHLEEAVRLFRAAEEAAKTSSDSRRALWSRFISLTELDDHEGAAAALEAFERGPTVSVDDALRARQGRLQSALRWGGLHEAIDGTGQTLELVPSSEDPVVRTGFLQTCGIALVLAARYSEAATIAEEELRQADRFKLDWVIPHAMEVQASAALGRREFPRALKTLRRVRELAQGNRHTELNADVIGSRVHLANGAPERAVELLEGREQDARSPGMRGDFLATLGLALGCLGSAREAEKCFDAAEAVTTHVDVRVLSAFGRVVADFQGSGALEVNTDHLSHACRLSRETGNFDSFVNAYRACPSLLVELATLDTDTKPFLQLVHDLDASLAQSLGLRAAPIRRTGEELTTREREILELLRQGLSNRQIAHTLWIVESTVKAHMRHIFEKLGVHSRTEAAARASEFL